MRTVFLAAAISALTLGLNGCGNDKMASSTQTNAPPKPPHCPETPGLGDVTLADGTIVDVRIITNGEITFYVPGDWYHEVFDRPSISAEPIRDHVDPFVEYEECPGVVHQWVTRVQDGGYGFSFVTPSINRVDGRAPQHFALESVIDGVSFGRPTKPVDGAPVGRNALDADVDQILPWNSRGKLETPKAYIVIVPGKLHAKYRWFRDKPFASPEWNAARESVKEFTSWLMTPPKDRDNNRIFKLGVA